MTPMGDIPQLVAGLAKNRATTLSLPGQQATAATGTTSSKTTANGLPATFSLGQRPSCRHHHTTITSAALQNPWLVGDSGLNLKHRVAGPVVATAAGPQQRRVGESVLRPG